MLRDPITSGALRKGEKEKYMSKTTTTTIKVIQPYEGYPQYVMVKKRFTPKHGDKTPVDRILNWQQFGVGKRWVKIMEEL